MRLLMLTKYGRKGASSRLRFMQYQDELTRHGFEITFGSLFSDEYLNGLYHFGRRSHSEMANAALHRLMQAITISEYDVVWLEGELWPWLPSAFEQVFLRSARRLVVDFDDAIFHRYEWHSSSFLRAMLKGKIKKTIGSADAVTAGNGYLADFARKAGARRIEDVPTVVDLIKYPAPVAYPSVGPPIIGWIGTPATEHYLQPIYSVLSYLQQSGRAKITLVGAGSRFAQHSQINSVKWTEETEVAEVSKFDIGIMPLSDDPWSRGKSGFKIVQYMACGKPVVASPVGVNLTLVEPGITGWLADTPDDWKHRLIQLLDDGVARRLMGENSRHVVETAYNVQVQLPRLLSVLSGR